MAKESSHFSADVILGCLEVAGRGMVTLESQLEGRARGFEPLRGGKRWGGE